MKTRIELNDDTASAVMKMSEGNPGALNCLCRILKESEAIDPQGGHGIMKLLMLDQYGIYGSDIYILYNDKCGCDLRKLLILIRATQLGLFSAAKLKELAADQCYRVNISDEEFSDLDNSVCERFEDFSTA